MDLFTMASSKENKTGLAKKPLSERMRPRNLEEFYGQKHIIGKGKLLRRLIESDQLTSIILYGPPGVGKTTLASIISSITQCEFVKINAVSSGVKEIREYIERSETLLKLHNKKTIFFIDEVHALKKGAQQDSLLEAIEKGVITLIGATTENPYFELNRALLSRSKIFQLELLTVEEIKDIILSALQDKERGYGDLKIEIQEEALQYIASSSAGDSRTALNALEIAVLSTPRNHQGIIEITRQSAEESMQKPMVNYDATGDQHYDVLSAFIKSIRGSDPDAALYWYGRMTLGGEDQRLIVRRLIVHASEDIGMADPNAMLIAMAAWNALETVGLPEARIPIAQAIIYLAKAAKSNAVIAAIEKAMEDAKSNQYRVPAHLRDMHYSGAAQLGVGGYKYPHDYPNHFVEQEYFPKEMGRRTYYVEDFEP